MAVNATAVWRVRPSGNNANGGGYDPGISGAATDYSQQNAAQASGTHGSGSATTTFTDATAANFTSAMVGNCINISGQGFYFVTAFLTSSTVTVDRTLGTFSGASWSLGGGWADPVTNLSSSGPLVNGNIVYVLGSGTPNPASYTYDYTVSSSVTIAANIKIANDPSTPGYLAPPNTTGGMPVIKFNVANYIYEILQQDAFFSGLWFVGTTTAASNYVIFNACNASNVGGTVVLGCVLDQFSYDLGLLDATPPAEAYLSNSIIGCEVFSSVAPGSAGSQAAFLSSGSRGGALSIIGCNIHDCVGYGVLISASVFDGAIIIQGSIIAKNNADGIRSATSYVLNIINNTIDGNLGNGIALIANDGAGTACCCVMNNIISNHTQSGKYGISNGANGGFTAGISGFFDYNVYYNNTSDLNGLSYGPHDTHGGSNPYVAQSTENYTLA